MRPDWEGALHHVMARGIRGEGLFTRACDCADMERRLSLLIPGLAFRVFAWVIMPNHMHLLIASGPNPLSSLMHPLLTGFAVSYNLRHERVGHVFQGRFKSILVEHDRYFHKLVRYIHLNPLRAGIVKSVIELKAFQWSGHPSLVGGTTCAWMDRLATLREFTEEEPPAADGYEKALMADIEGREDVSELDRGNLIIGRNGLEEIGSPGDDRSWSQGCRVLGSREFGLDVLARLRGVGGLVLRDRKEVHDSMQQVFERIENRWGLTRDVIRSGRRSTELADIRSAIAWVAYRKYGLTCSDISRILGCTRSSVTHHLSRCSQLFLDRPFIIEYLIQ